MTPAVQPRFLTFQEFVDYDDGTSNLYELVNGELIAMPEPDQLHEAIATYLLTVFYQAILAQRLPLAARLRATFEGNLVYGRRPDVAIFPRRGMTPHNAARRAIRDVPRLVVEVASTNFVNDIHVKRNEYALAGIPEFWIVDYRGQIPDKYLQRGRGKKVIRLLLDDRGQYAWEEFLPGEEVPCQTIPGMAIAVDDILNPPQ